MGPAFLAVMAAGFVLGSGLGSVSAGGTEDFVFAEGTPYASPGFVAKGDGEGPRVVCVAGLGEDQRGAEWLEALREEFPAKGELVVIPSYRAPSESDGNALRRGFPKAEGEGISLDAARVFWEELLALEPDLVIEIGSGGTPRASTDDRNHYGNTAFHGGAGDSQEVRNAAVLGANALVEDGALRWDRLSNPLQGGLTRSLGDGPEIASLYLLPASKVVDPSAVRDQTLAAIHGALERVGVRERPLVNHASLGDGKFRVAIFLDGGVGGTGPWSVHSEMKSRPDTYVAFINGEDVRRGALDHFDVAVFPGGGARSQGRSLGEEGRKRVVDFVANGGGYFGICAGAYLGCSSATGEESEGRLGLINAKTKSPKWQRGNGRVDLEATPQGVEVLGAVEAVFDVRYGNGPVVEPAGIEGLPEYDTLAYYRTELAENDTPEGIMVDSPAFLSAEFGKGRAILFSPHPESDEHLRHLVTNAIDWVAGKHKGR